MSESNSTSQKPSEARQTLRRRAAELSQPARVEAKKNLVEIVRFRVGPAWYALEHRHLCEILPLRALAALPGLPSFVAGIIDLRGQIWSILDSRVVLGLPEGEPLKETKAVLLGSESMEFGLSADEVEGVVALSTEEIHASSAVREAAGGRYVVGTHRSGTVLLDGAKMLGDPELVVSQ